MPPPVASGLLWSTDSEIPFSPTGPAVPAIPVARAAGPLYVVISYSQAVTPGEDEPTIFTIGNPADNLYTVSRFHVHRNYGTGIGVATTPGRGIMVDLPAPPSDFVGEFWASSTGSSMVSYLNPGWYMDPIPDHNPVATSHLFIGYKPNPDNGGAAAWRGAGTVHKMAIYNRIPSVAERAQLVEWVQSQGAPAIAASLAATEGSDTAAAIATVRWPKITGGLSATEVADSASIQSTLRWPKISAEVSGTEESDSASIQSTLRWPKISAEVRGVEGSDSSVSEVSIGIKASASIQEALETASVVAVARWPRLSAAVEAVEEPDAANLSAEISVKAGITAGELPDSASAQAAVRWPKITANLTAEEKSDTISVLTGASWPKIIAGLTAGEQPDTAAVLIGEAHWPKISAGIVFVEESDVALFEAGVRWPLITAGLSVGEQPDIVDVSVSLSWPKIIAGLVAEEHPDILSVVVGEVHWPIIRAGMAANEQPDESSGLVLIKIRGAIETNEFPDTAAILTRMWVEHYRHAFPGESQGGVLDSAPRQGILQPSIRSGIISRG